MGAANRDERRWNRADELDLAREPKRNLAFGEGIHHCLGAPLARLQGRIVLEGTLRAMPHSTAPSSGSRPTTRAASPGCRSRSASPRGGAWRVLAVRGAWSSALR